MRKMIFTILSAAALTVSAQTGVYQVGNSDFETKWTDDNEPGNGWNSFGSANTSGLGFFGSWAQSSSKKNTVKTTGHNGSKTAVQLKSSSIFGTKANGNLTTGTINMGSSMPTNKSNHNYTDLSGEYKNCRFAGRPDSVVYYAKFKRGGSGDYKGRLHALIHGNYAYKDPYETAENKAKYLIAEATVYADVSSDWVRYSGAFTYTGKEDATSYLLASFTTNEKPGATVNDEFDIDDISFIYNSQLASVTYDGASVSVATAMNVAKAYDPNKISLTSNGVGASIEKNYNATTGLLTITVKGNDVSVNPTNVHTYTIQFATASAAPKLASISVGGQSLTDFGLTFNPATTTYTLPIAYHRGIVVEGVADANSTLVAESATENAFYDNSAKTITLKVKDSDNHEVAYVLHFTDAVAAAEAGQYPGALSVVLTPTSASGLSKIVAPLTNAPIQLTKNSNGTYNVALPNFSFGSMLVGDIYVANVPVNGNNINVTRTIRLTSDDESAIGSALGHLPVSLKMNLISTTDKHLEGDIDIITTGNTNPAVAMFSSIHVDYVPFTVDENSAKNSNAEGDEAYAKQTLGGYISKASTKFIHLNETTVGKPMTYVDMSGASVAANVTADDLKQGAVATNNTLYYLPSTSTLTGKNLISNGRTTEFALNDAAAIEVPTQFSADKASYNRNFTTTGYTTFALPVATAASTLNGTVYELKGFNADRSAFDFAPVTNIEANKPYLFEANNAALFANGAVTVAVANANTEVKTHTGVGVEQEGNYGETKVLASDATNTYYGYSNGQFVKATTGTLNRYRTAFSVANTAAGARSFAISINGTVTGIITLDNGTMSVEKGQVFDLQGRRVLTTQKGQTYIINGKKVIL